MSRVLVFGLLALAGLVACTASAWATRRRGAPAASSFAASAAIAGVGALLVGTAVAWNLPESVVFGVAMAIGLSLPVPWLLFSFDYTGRGEVLSFSVATAASVPPAIGLAASATILGAQVVPGVGIPTQAAASGLAAVGVALLQTVRWLTFLYAGGLMLVGSAVLLWTFQRYDHLDATTGTLLGTFGTVPWLSLVFGFQVDSLSPLALPGSLGIGFLVGGVAAAGAVGPYRLFAAVPAAGNVGPATVVEELEDLVVVTDDDGTVVELNRAAQRDLGAARGLVGADVESLLEASIEELRGTDTVGLQTDAGRAIFEPTVSALTDQHGRPLGYAVVLRDVTARTTRRQRLEVFNRVLRHNLRNDMTVILGHAELLERRLDGDLADSARTIAETGESLSDLAATAREADRVMDETAEDGQDVHLRPLVDRVVGEAAEGRATCEVDVPSGLVAVGAADLLGLALVNLVENAVVHSDRDRPWVAVRAEFDPDATAYPLTLTVADDGPGIPEGERSVVAAGTETPLEHGTGLGLWIVRWSVTRLGGAVDFGERDPRGSVVTLRLPNARLAPADGEDGGGGDAEPGPAEPTGTVEADDD